MMTISLEQFKIDAKNPEDDIIAVTGLLNVAMDIPTRSDPVHKMTERLLAYNDFRGPGSRGSFKVYRDAETAAIKALAYVVRYKNSIEIPALAVDKDCRGQGLGKAILEILTREGLPLWLYVNRRNNGGYRFFTENGFRELPDNDFRQDETGSYIVLERPTQEAA